MYIENLTEQIISIDDIYLDPNNPRFWTERTGKDIPDSKVTDDNVQTRTAESIKTHGIAELRDSILRNGFLPLDRIVVRELDGNAGSFVVVEGNRRLAALRLLRKDIEEDIIDEEHIDEDYLRTLKQQTDTLSVLIYNGLEKDDISWLLQGIRHISGIRDWQPAQRARLVSDQIDNKGMKFREAGQQFGLTPHAVGRLYRAYKALEQMREDDEFQSRADNKYFSLFEEAYRNKNVRKWLSWNDDKNKFEDIDNLKQFYEWITPDDEHDNERRIDNPKEIQKLGYLIDGNYKSLLDQVDQHKITIDSAYDSATEREASKNWQHAMTQVGEIIDDIPNSVLRDNTAEFLKELKIIESKLKKQRKMAESLSK